MDNTSMLIDAAIDDLKAAGYDPRRPVVAGALAGALASVLHTGARGRPLVDLLADAVDLTITAFEAGEVTQCPKT